MRVGLQDIAKQTGCSVATVSRAIRGVSGISPSTREHIRKVADKLGYHPNAAAKALTSGRTGVLGVALYDLSYLTGPYFSSIVSGIAEVSDKYSSGLLFSSSRNDGLPGDAECVQIAKERRVDAMIVIDQIVPEAELQLLSRLGISLVLIDQDAGDACFPVVRVDYRRAFKDATMRLIGLGHRRIAFLGRNKTLLYSEKESWAGYTEAMSECGMCIDSKLVVGDSDVDFGSINDRAGLNHVLDCFDSYKEPPTAFLSTSDRVSLALPAILRERGFKVPEDVSVIGISTGDGELPGLLSVDTISVPSYELGKAACELALNLLNGKVAAREIVIDAILETRSAS